MQERPRRRRRWLFACKAAVSLGLLAWLGARAVERDGFGALAERVGSLDAGWLAVAVALHLAAVLAGVARWRVLLRAARIELPFRWLLRSFLVGRFVGAFTPSTTGLDGWRLFEAGRASGSMVRSAAAIGVEKLVGLVAMACVCAALVPFGGLSSLGPSALPVAAALALGAGVGLWLFGRPSLLGRLAAALPGPLGARAREGIRALSDSRLSRRALAQSISLGMASHLALSAVFVATARAVGVDVSGAQLLVVGNAIVLAVLLPVSVGGVGIREGVAVVLLAGAGVASTDAMLVALSGYLTGQVPALLGGVAMAVARAQAPAEPAVAEAAAAEAAAVEVAAVEVAAVEVAASPLAVAAEPAS